MGRACCRLLVILMLFLVFMPFSFAAMTGSSNAEDNPFIASVSNINSQQLQTTSIIPLFADMEQRLATGFKDYNDENFRFFDAMMKGYMQDVQTKAIVGIFGINLLVAGLVFYFINKETRKYSYESVMLNRRKTDEDRKYLVDAINTIRDRMNYMEEDIRKKSDLSVVPIEVLDQEMRRRHEFVNKSYEEQRLGGFGGVQYGDGQGEAQADVSVAAGSYGQQEYSANAAEYGAFEAQRRDQAARLL